MSKLRKFAVHKDNALMRLMIMLIVPCILIGSVSMHAYAQSGYVIYDGEDRQVVLSEATSLPRSCPRPASSWAAPISLK